MREETSTNPKSGESCDKMSAGVQKLPFQFCNVAKQTLRCQTFSESNDEVDRDMRYDFALYQGPLQTKKIRGVIITQKEQMRFFIMCF